MLTYTPAALTNEEKKRQPLASVYLSQNSADVLRCRAYLQGLNDGFVVGRQRRNWCLVERQVRWLEATRESTPRTQLKMWQPALPTARDVLRRQNWQLAASRR
jgi:hypothetical protein